MQAKLAWHWRQDFWNDYYLKHPLLLFLLLVYTILGAMIFVTFERPRQEMLEEQWRTEVERFRRNSLENLSKVLFNTSELLIFLDPHRGRVAQDILRNWSVNFEVHFYDLFLKRDRRTLDWDMWNASVFAMSVYTTIGYKNLYPVTLEGRVTLVVYAVVGVPLLLSVLTNVTSAVHHLLKYLWNKLCLCDKYSKDGCFVEIPVLLVVIALFVWISASSASCMLWKRKWNYFDAFYFFFLSFSTIGLTGIDEMHPAFYFLIWFYVIVALALVSLCFKLLQLKSKPHQSLATERPRDSLSTRWVSNWNDSLSVSELEKTFDKRSFKSFLTAEYPSHAKLLLSTDGNGGVFKSLDTVNMLMEAYKEELLWLVHSGRYSSEEQSMIDLTTVEEQHEFRHHRNTSSKSTNSSTSDNEGFTITV